jgi:hypothetical protein
MGSAIAGGTRRVPVNTHASEPNAIQPMVSVARKVRSAGRAIAGLAGRVSVSALVIFAVLIIAFGFAKAAETPPPDLVRRIAHHEDETVEERKNYAYRQTVRLQELSEHGAEVGRYSEVRDIVFSPAQERTEKTIGLPLTNLKNLKMTDEDFRDLREIQPFVLREEFLPNYDVKFRGEEDMDGVQCWVVQIRPKQILQNQRFFEGLLWAAKSNYAIVRTEGQAVPQIYSTHQENLFPRFTTIRKPVNGFWFPAVTYADDTLPFHTGPLRIKLTIRYTNYQKFGSSTIITFDEK